MRECQSKLVAHLDSCPCGFYGDPFRQCTCPTSLVSRYQRRISVPFIDRVDIFVVPSSGGAPEQLTFYGGSDTQPDWSPDSNYITFGSDRSGNWDIWAIPATGGAPEQLTTHPGWDDVPDWSPDGRQIAFTSDRGGNVDIWVMDVEGATPVESSTWGRIKAIYRR